MIRSFRHKALEAYWTKGNPKGLNPDFLSRLRRLLSALDVASRPEDMNVPGFKFHALIGDRAGAYAVSVNKNWRLTFAWNSTDAIDTDLEDYH